MSNINSAGKTYGNEFESQAYEETEVPNDFEAYGADDNVFENLGWEDEFFSGVEGWSEESGETAEYSLGDMEGLLSCYEDRLAKDSALPDGLKASLQEKVDDAQRNLGFAQLLSGKALQNTLIALEASLCEIEQGFTKGEEAAPLIAELDTLIAELEATDFSADQQGQKTEWLEQLNKAKHALELGAEPAAMENASNLLGEIPYEFEVQKMEMEEKTANLNAPLDNLLAYLQSMGDSTTSSESLKTALSDSGLTLQDLQSLVLPASAELHGKIFKFIEKVDVRFAQLLADNADNPYTDEVLNRFSEILTQVLPHTATITSANVKVIFKDSGLFFFPEEGAVTANLPDDPFVTTSDKFEMKSFANAIDEALKSGDWDDIHLRLTGMSGEQGNDLMRKYITALYTAVGEDEAAFQKALDQIPAEVREAMANVAYATWAERSEIHIGDRWNSHETYSILYNSTLD